MTAKRGFKCDHCREMQTRHDEKEPGVFVCADGTIATFKRFVTDPTRRTQSFHSREINFMVELFETLQRGGDVSVLARAREAAKLAGKFRGMRRKSILGKMVQRPRRKKGK